MSAEGKGDSASSKRGGRGTETFGGEETTGEKRSAPEAGIVSSWEERVEGSSAQTTTAPQSTAQQQASFTSPRQVIAVSASKGPAAFFNLARKFLATDEMCDLSALEGAIVSAVDAAHLLERSKLASIVRIQTSYVAVEPKRKKQATAAAAAAVSAPISPATAAPIPQPLYVGGISTASQSQSSQVSVHRPTPQQQTPVTTSTASSQAASAAVSSLDTKLPAAQVQKRKVGETMSQESGDPHQKKPQSSQGGMQPQAAISKATGRELRRARIIITVKRTPEYAQWLMENPAEASGEGGEGDEDDEESPHPTSSGRLALR